MNCPHMHTYVLNMYEFFPNRHHSWTTFSLVAKFAVARHWLGVYSLVQ